MARSFLMARALTVIVSRQVSGSNAAFLLPELDSYRNTIYGTIITSTKVLCQQEDIGRFKLARCAGRPLRPRSTGRRGAQSHGVHQAKQSAARLQSEYQVSNVWNQIAVD
jgi:hypothetical protein